MAMRCRVKIGTYRADDIMNNEKWAANQRSKNAAYQAEKIKLTKDFLNHLCSLVEPNYKSSYVDYDRLLFDNKKNEKGM